MERYRAWILMTRIAVAFTVGFVAFIALAALVLARCS